MTFSYPLRIAHELLNVISSLPTTSIEVHGMGIFEKIFEIGNTMLDVLHALEGTEGLGVEGSGLGTGFGGLENGTGLSVVNDPFEVFIKTLSGNPNSKRQYANLLLQKAREKPFGGLGRLGPEIGGVAFANSLLSPESNTVSPELGNMAVMNVGGMGTGSGNGLGLGINGVGAGQGGQWRGSIVGEIQDDGTYKVHDDTTTDDQGVTWTSIGDGNDLAISGNAGWISGSDDGSGGSLLVGDMDGGWSLKME